MLNKRTKDPGRHKDEAKNDQNNVKEKEIQASYTLETASQDTGELWTEIIKRTKKGKTTNPTPAATVNMQSKQTTDKVKFKIIPPAILVNINRENLPTLARKIRADVN